MKTGVGMVELIDNYPQSQLNGCSRSNGIQAVMQCLTSHVEASCVEPMLT